MDAMMRNVTEDSAGGVRVGQESVMDLDFADDVALLVDSLLVLMGKILKVKVEEVTQRFGTNISAKKSEILYIGKAKGNLKLASWITTETARG